MLLIPLLIGAGLLVLGIVLLRRVRLLALPLLFLGALVVAATAVGLVKLKPYRVPSGSMEPTVKFNDRILVWKGSPGGVGDIVVYHPPTGATAGAGPECGVEVVEGQLCPRPTGKRSGVAFIKRIVAVGGDRIRMRDGHVIRNGREVREPYAADCGTVPECTTNEITIPRGSVFLLGDNRGQSDDSRFWGPVPKSWAIGRVVGRYWPLERAGGI